MKKKPGDRCGATVSRLLKDCRFFLRHYVILLIEIKERGSGMTLYSGKALAGALGLTVQEVEKLRSAGVIRYRKGRTYALEESARSILAYYKEQGEENASAPADYQTERALLMRAKRMEQEYETGLKDGKLHASEDVEAIVTKMLMNFRSRIMAIPAKLASRLSKESDTTAIFEILKEATDDALNELSDYDGLFANERDTEEN